MCAACGCGKKKGEPGYGKGKDAKKAAPAKKAAKKEKK